MNLTPAMIARARAAADDLMDDTCTIVRRTLSSSLNESGLYTNTDVRIYPPVVDGDDSTTAPCRLKKVGGSQVTEIDAQGQPLVESSYVLSLPTGTSTGVQQNDIVIMATSAFDPALAGREFRVEGPAAGTHTTARRFSVEETT